MATPPSGPQVQCRTPHWVTLVGKRAVGYGEAPTPTRFSAVFRPGGEGQHTTGAVLRAKFLRDLSGVKEVQNLG